MENMTIQKALVTGGAGFIGSHLVDALIRKGVYVVVLDDLSRGNLENLKKAKKTNAVSFLKGDIRDVSTVAGACRNVDTVFHMAAKTAVPDTISAPIESNEINITGTLNVFDAARHAGVGRVVFAGSCAVYGDHPELPKTESSPISPKSPYAVQKYTGELYARLYHDLYNLETVTLRFFNVYGPRQDPSSPYSGVISIFMDKAASKTPPVIHGDGRQFRDFVYVTDVVDALIKAALVPAAAGRTFNIGTGDTLSIIDLWDQVKNITGSTLSPQYGPARSGDIRGSRADTTLAESLLGFKPQVKPAAGLAALWTALHK